jgi:hypothetical protein
VVEHPPAPARPGSTDAAAAGAASEGDQRSRAAALAAAVGAGRRVRVAGGGALGEQVRQALTAGGAVVLDGESDGEAGGEAGGTAAAAPVDVVVDLDPSAASVVAGLAALGPTGTLLVGGRTGPVELDVQSEIHKRGATVQGPAAADRSAPDDVRVPSGREQQVGRWQDG